MKIELFNPFRDSLGRFASKVGGGRRIFKESKGNFQLKGEQHAARAMKVAGAAAGASVVLDIVANGKNIPPKYRAAAEVARGVARVTALASTGIGSAIYTGVYGRAAGNNLKNFGVEVRREITYKGKNKKPVFERVKDTFNAGRKSIGYTGLTALSLAGAITTTAMLYKLGGGSLGKADKYADFLQQNIGNLGGVVGAGWKDFVLNQMKQNLEIVELQDVEETTIKDIMSDETIEAMFTLQLYLNALVEDNKPFIVDPHINFNVNQTKELLNVLTVFLAIYLGSK